MIPAIFKDLGAPICCKIFNLKYFASETDVDHFLADPTILLCNCDKSLFTD